MLAGMQIKREIIVFDAADLEAVSGFWARLLDGQVEKEDDWHTVYVGGVPHYGVQLAQDHVQPEWPDGSPQQIHLDLYVEDINAGHQHALASGARLLQDADRDAAHGFVVYADPAGHPFCLCWG
jgi:catechol 2,3-dioxygenase-like lactoylglutathione lyase family enzyme